MQKNTLYCIKKVIFYAVCLLKCVNVVAMSHFKMLAMEHGKSGGLTKKMLGNRTMVC